MKELRTTGYVHNHARMWFSSIWIYYLKLPWQLGADLFYRHLLDGDPASNTLSWRWVAGLHTKGKRYIARSENIERFTNARFIPDNLEDLDFTSIPENDFCDYKIEEYQYGVSLESVDDRRQAVLLHEEDLYLESSLLKKVAVEELIVLYPDVIKELIEYSGPVQRYKEEALKDATLRSERHFGC